MSGFPRRKRYNNITKSCRMIICVKAVMIPVMAVFIYDFFPHRSKKFDVGQGKEE